uniref:Uncharacterized protein n=1 Tax=Panagrolaimus sp. PS1159 TaxID=55785 RepID=A0AC35GMI4_9BILA
MATISRYNDDYIITKSSDTFYIFNIPPMSPASSPQLRDDLNKLLTAARQKREDTLPPAADTTVSELPEDPNYVKDPGDPPKAAETAAAASGSRAVETSKNFKKKGDTATTAVTVPLKTNEKVASTIAKTEEKNVSTEKKEESASPKISKDVEKKKETEAVKTNSISTVSEKKADTIEVPKAVEIVKSTEDKVAEAVIEPIPPVSDAFTKADTTKVTASDSITPMEPSALPLPPLSKEGEAFIKTKEGEAFMKLVKPIVGVEIPTPPLKYVSEYGVAMEENTKSLALNSEVPLPPLTGILEPDVLSHPPLTDLITPQMYKDHPYLATKNVVRNPEISQIYFNWRKERERFQIMSYDTNVQEIFLSPQLGYVMGFKENIGLVPGTVAKYPPDLKGLTQFGIYTKELSENVVVGNELTTLLRIVTVKSKPGEMDEQLYDSPMYVRVASRDISSINIELRGMDGRLIPFSFGPVIITLHFKKLLY